jgi:hypothetical protein
MGVLPYSVKYCFGYNMRDLIGFVVVVDHPLRMMHARLERGGNQTEFGAERRGKARLTVDCRLSLHDGGALFLASGIIFI